MNELQLCDLNIIIIRQMSLEDQKNIITFKGIRQHIFLSSHMKEHVKICNNLFTDTFYLTLFRRYFFELAHVRQRRICMTS